MNGTWPKTAFLAATGAESDDTDPVARAIFLGVLVAAFGALYFYGRNWTTKEDKERSAREDEALPFRQRILNFGIPEMPKWISVLLLIVTVLCGLGLLGLPILRAMSLVP